MIINAASLRDLFTGFNTSFNKGFGKAPTHWEKIAMKTVSTGKDTNYSWLTDFPGLRQWIGDRVYNDLSAARYVVENHDFELTVTIKRNNIEDDQYGIYAKTFESMGYEIAMHPDDLVFSLLKKGETTPCYDGQYFFDTDHSNYGEAGNAISVSNFTAGEGPAWYLVDGSKAVMPMIFQERKPFVFESITNENDSHVFNKAEYVYGTHGRSNAGFGLWQLAFCNKNPLNEVHFISSKLAMASYRRPSGKPLGVAPTHLVVPPQLEQQARKLVNATLIGSGESNVLAGSVEVVVSPFLM